MGRLALDVVVGTLTTLLLQLGAGLLGPAGIFLNLFTPLPVAMAVMRRGGMAGGFIVALTASMLLIFGEPMGAVGYFIQFGIASVVLPLLLLRGRNWDEAVFLALLINAGAAAVAVAGYAFSRGAAVGEILGKYVQAEVDRAMALYREAQLPPEQAEEIRQLAQMMADFLVHAWPGLAIVVSGVVLLLTVLLIGAFSRGRYEVPGPPFGQWKAPEMLIWVLIAGGIGVLLSGWPRNVGLNLLTVMLPVYFLQGLAIITWFFRKRNVSPFFRNLGYMMVVLMNPLPLIVTGMGIFDLWIDFRKSRIRKT